MKVYCCETFDIWLMSALTAKTKRYQNLNYVRDNNNNINNNDDDDSYNRNNSENYSNVYD